MLIYTALVLHWVADFICQTRQMANNKSTSLKWLASHVLVYAFVMSLLGLKFALINGAFHFVTDFITSRGASYFWKRQNVHAFFAVIGFDQLLHNVVLLWSIKYAHCIIPGFL